MSDHEFLLGKTLLGYSNANLMMPELNMNFDGIEYEHIETFTLDQIVPNIQSNTLEEYDLVLIHTGSNDIRRNMSAENAMRQLKTATEELEKKHIEYLVAQPPPLYTTPMSCQRQMISYQTLISDKYGERTIVTDEMYEQPNYIQSDDLHLSTMGREKAAQLIHDQVTQKTGGEKKTPQTPEANPNRVTITIKTDKTKAAKVIGKEGQRIKAIKAKNGVNIDTEYLENGSRLFILQGDKENTNKARQEIEKIIQETTREDENKFQEKQRRRSNMICRNYTRGKCEWGPRCKFIHSKGPTDVSPPSPKRRRSYSPDANDSRSGRHDMRPHPDYHKQTHRDHEK